MKTWNKINIFEEKRKMKNNVGSVVFNLILQIPFKTLKLIGCMFIEEPLVIEKGNFGWGTSVPVLHDIDIKIFDKSLVAVVGTVGCGKSSLLAAFLGEMDLISGRVNTKV